MAKGAKSMSEQQAVALPPEAVVVNEVPKYKCLEDTFIAPWLIKAGKIIEYDGEPGSHLEPLNDAARKMMDAYYKAKPEARISPMDALPITEGANPKPQFAVVGDAPPDEIISFVDMAERAGYSDKPARVESLAEAAARGASVG
jgi:hypothetical protein